MLKGSAILFFLVVAQGMFWDCGTRDIQKSKPVQIRVINNTELSFTHVSMFSMSFEDLQPNDTSEYKELRYDPLRHDPLIYCFSDGINYGRYLRIPEKGTGQYTYVIDSLKNKIIYVSSKVDD